MRRRRSPLSLYNSGDRSERIVAFVRRYHARWRARNPRYKAAKSAEYRRAAKAQGALL